MKELPRMKVAENGCIILGYAIQYRAEISRVQLHRELS